MSDGPKVVAVRQAIIGAILCKDRRAWPPKISLTMFCQLLYESGDILIDIISMTMQTGQYCH